MGRKHFAKWRNSVKANISKIKGALALRNMRTKLTISYLLLTLFPLVIIAIFVFNISIMTLKNEVSEYVSNTLDQINNNIDNTFIQLTNISAEIGMDETLQEILNKDASRPIREKIADDEKVNEIIENAIANFTNIESLHIFSYSGEVYSMKGAGNSLVTDYNFTRKKWFQNMKKLNKRSLIIPTYLQTDIISEGSNKKVFGYITEINDIKTQNNIGYFMIEMDIGIFSNLLKSISADQPSVVIIDDNKTVIYHTQPEYISSQFQHDYVSELLEKKEGHMIRKTGSGEELIIYNTSANTGWTVLSIIPTDLLFSRINSFELALVYTIILCILSSIVISVLMSNSLTEPISVLKRRMKMAESGDFDLQIEVKSKDEIGELSLSFNKMLSRIKNLIQRVYQTEILRKEAELSALQAQINPHFLYNTLQIMDIMAEEKGADEISGSCRALARIFRYSISKGQGFVSLEEEVLHVKNYVYIQQLRLESKLTVIYEIPEELYRYETVKLVLQPLVENGIIHGVEKSGRSCIIKVSARLHKTNLILEVEDNGIGMDKEELLNLQASLYQKSEMDSRSSGSGIALKNVNDRIKLYYSDKYGMTIQSTRNVGTKVTLVLPAKLHE